ncbi:hypothetical protein AGRA3207_003660 [Actinomadura graeca]|uniref:Uncharacterized protein n=1 Tax=Actinomadura graeca TaxID=2750812 RepID=A0ABX8R0T2_9ACTN|nr:hypothetical protein [Actinomadura graeca]QXJ22628.1 hypothetical protein AGRA3207_003660 [Actinomadura graeca]
MSPTRLSTQQRATSRRAALAEARKNRRPSRLGTKAGSADGPDFVLEPDAGFPGLLKRTWQHAAEAPDPGTAFDVLLTLGGHIPARVGLRGLRVPEEVSAKILFGRSWRTGDPDARPAAGGAPGGAPGAAAGGETAFAGEIALTTAGRVAVRAPGEAPLAGGETLVDGVLRVPWSAEELASYRREIGQARALDAQAVTTCRRSLDAAGPDGRAAMLEGLREAARRTAPFFFYRGAKLYTNFRERNNLTGKTLWPGHPDCMLSSLAGLPLELWPDDDAVVVTCLSTYVRSGGYARIEEVNGTQVSVDHIADLLERTRERYNALPADPGAAPVAPAYGAGIEPLGRLAGDIADRRRRLRPDVLLYREIHGPLVHKVERTAGSPGPSCRRSVDAVLGRLRARLPVEGATFADVAAGLRSGPEWLARPHGTFGTGLESLVHETVDAVRDAIGADFAMSRGMRSLPRLITAMRAGDWAEIAGWDLPEYFCCVVPSATAQRLFDDTRERLADVAWAISARMQYNSWHFCAGNLPGGPVVDARDYFAPPGIPDIAHYSDQHHNGHVAARVRFSIRSPQAVRVLDRTFRGFIDLRLLRCEGEPFDEQDLLAAHHASGLIAGATSGAAALAAAGSDAEVTAFDSRWHWAAIVDGALERAS